MSEFVRLAAAGIFVGTAALTLSGCGLFGGGSAQDAAGNGSGSAPPGVIAADPASDLGEPATASEQTLDVWGDDGCLEYLVLDSADDTVAVSATNLCRAELSQFPGDTITGAGTFWAFFARGGNLDNWQEIAGRGADGYTYWEYTDGQLYRQPTGGGAVQLEVGQGEFEDESTYLQQNPGGFPFLKSVTEGLAAQAITREMAGQPVQQNPQLPVSDTAEVPQAQSNISAQDQQAQQIGQTYEDAQAAATAAQASLDVTQARQDEDKIIFANDCTGSDNVEDGCGGADAFNDDDGVGEGGG
jgi:hypothetical protein